MRVGMDVGNPDVLQKRVQHLSATLGEEWLEKRIATFKARAEGSRDQGSRLLAALADYPTLLAALRASQPPPDPAQMVYLAMIAWVVSECTALAGGAEWGKKLSSLAQAEQWNGFFDALFEGEATLYWRDQMHATVAFPSSSHPDFQAVVMVGGRTFSIPNECKRISPAEQREEELQALAMRLDGEVNQWVKAHAPMKIVVWLHAEPSRIAVSDVMSLLADVATKALDSSNSPRWLTASQEKGLYQVSVAAAGELGELKERPIEVRDIPAVGPLFVRVDKVYLGKSQDPVKLRYVLSVRSDVLPNRIGALERNLRKAVRQVAISTSTPPGAVNIRIRPPRALGDLYETDSTVHRVLRETGASHIALVVLFWNEGEREEEEWKEVDGQPQRAVTVGYGLVPYFVSHGRTPIDFSTIDSKVQRFGSDILEAIRDPETGSMIPVSRDLLEQVKNAKPCEQPGSDAPQSERGFFVYVELADGFPAGIKRQAIQPVKCEGRVFVPIFDDQRHVRFVEFVDEQPVRVASLDLRAWEGQRELLFTVRLDGEEWTVSSPLPDESAHVRAVSAPLRRVT